ncbi:MAG: hypothetical protein ACYC09_04535 [Bacteroidota bacterium]
MTSDEFIKIIESNPDLTTHGNGLDIGTDCQSFSTERANLFKLLDEANLCEEFLLKCKRTANPQDSIGSTYRIKQLVERYVKREYDKSIYIPEGVVQIAAIHLGFKMKPKDNSTSVYLNISKKTKIQNRWINCF